MVYQHLLTVIRMLAVRHGFDCVKRRDWTVSMYSIILQYLKALYYVPLRNGACSISARRRFPCKQGEVDSDILCTFHDWGKLVLPSSVLPFVYFPIFPFSMGILCTYSFSDSITQDSSFKINSRFSCTHQNIYLLHD